MNITEARVEDDGRYSFFCPADPDNQVLSFLSVFLNKPNKLQLVSDPLLPERDGPPAVLPGGAGQRVRALPDRPGVRVQMQDDVKVGQLNSQRNILKKRKTFPSAVPRTSWSIGATATLRATPATCGRCGGERTGLKG